MVPDSRPGHNPEILEESFAALEMRAAKEIRDILAGESDGSGVTLLDVHVHGSSAS